jgi:hypothetical protein
MNNTKKVTLEIGEVVVENNSTGYFISPRFSRNDSIFADFGTVETLKRNGFIRHKNIIDNMDHYEVVKPYSVLVKTGILGVTTINMLSD